MAKAVQLKDKNGNKVFAAPWMPIGSIYMSIYDTNPKDLFGGTWEQIKDVFLLGSGDTYSNGATGGSANVTLTVNQMPKHTHEPSNGSNYGFLTYKQGGTTTRSRYASGTSGAYTHQATTQSDLEFSGATASSGNSEAHDNMPPYLVVYMWKRIA